MHTNALLLARTWGALTPVGYTWRNRGKHPDPSAVKNVSVAYAIFFCHCFKEKHKQIKSNFLP